MYIWVFKKGMLWKVNFVIRSLIAKKLNDHNGRIFFLFLLFHIDFLIFQLFALGTNLTSCALPNVHEIHVFSTKMSMVFDILTRPLFFPWETLTSIGLQWQKMHHMIWGLQELICAPSLTIKNPKYLVRQCQGYHMLWLCKSCEKVNTQYASPSIFDSIFHVSCGPWIIFLARDKFTILVINLKYFCVKVNATCRCHLKLLHPFSCNMNITTKKREGWKDAMLLLHLCSYNKKHTNNKKEKWKGRKHNT